MPLRGGAVLIACVTNLTCSSLLFGYNRSKSHQCMKACQDQLPVITDSCSATTEFVTLGPVVLPSVVL